MSKKTPKLLKIITSQLQFGQNIKTTVSALPQIAQA
jgi:hypothetical protein